MGEQALAQLHIVRALAHMAPVVLKAVHHILSWPDPLEEAMRGVQKQGVGVDEQGLFRQFQPFGDGAGLASMVITVFALPGREGLLAQGDGVDRPARIVLRAIGHDPDAQ